MSKITEETRRIKSKWVQEAIETCRTYLPEEMPNQQRQVASLFFYVCAIDPKKEAGTVCDLLKKAWEEPLERQCQRAAELLNVQYRKQITGSIDYYLVALFAPAGTRNFAMRGCANHILTYCRKKMKGATAPAELDEWETRCRHLVYVRERIKQVDAEAAERQKNWHKNHIFSGVIRLKKEQTQQLKRFLISQDPKSDPDCGRVLDTFTFPNGAVATVYLRDITKNNKPNIPACVIQVKTDSATEEAACVSFSNRETTSIEIKDDTYHFKLECYERPQFAYDSSKISRERMKLGYPQNLIAEILNTAYSGAPSDSAKSELEAALSQLDERKRTFILLRYRDEKTYREIAEMWNLTASRAREVTNNGIRRLRSAKLLQTLRGEATAAKAEAESKPKYASIADCSFSTRLYNCLMRGGITTIEELQGKSWEELSNLRNLGSKCREELAEYCKTHNISLKE